MPPEQACFAGQTEAVADQLTTTWPQVLAWRMRRHLHDPVGEVDVADIVERLCGIQAQVPSAAALAIGVRQQKPVPDAMGRALHDGDLVRTWAMRGTLHLLPPAEAGAYLALVGAARPWERGSWQRTFGMSPDEIVALTDAVVDVLDGRVLTREQLVDGLADRLGRPDLTEQLRSGWGAVLKPVAWQGALCHGAADGTRVTFGRPDQLVPGWGGVPDLPDAARIVIPAYLRAYGPATVERFDAWLTRGISKKATLRGWFADLEDLLATVDVDGASAFLLAEDVAGLAATSPTTAVRLLPGFDQYVLGPGTAATEIISPERRAEVSRTAGWISPVLVVGGRVAGVWEAADGAPQVMPFAEAEPVPPEALATEVDRLTSVMAALAA